MPVPASKMNRRPSARRTSTQGVLPPYRTVEGPGLGMEPRVPQQMASMTGGGSLGFLVWLSEAASMACSNPTSRESFDDLAYCR